MAEPQSASGESIAPTGCHSGTDLRRLRGSGHLVGDSLNVCVQLVHGMEPATFAALDRIDGVLRRATQPIDLCRILRTREMIADQSFSYFLISPKILFLIERR